MHPITYQLYPPEPVNVSSPPPATPPPNQEPSPVTKKMHDLDPRRKLSIMIAVMASMLFAALNQTTVGTALPHIISDLGGLEYFSWVFSSYILAAAIPAVLVGRMSDIYGRRPLIISGVIVFIVGTVLCGFATNIYQLILYRMLQGVGGGAIMAMSFTIVGDLYVQRERGRWQGFLGASFGLASLFGPTLGGFIVDHWHWKWVFWVFIPVGVVALVMIYSLLPKVEKRQGHGVDLLGAGLFVTILMPLLLALSWGGQRYAWVSVEIIGLLASSIVSLIFFISAQRQVRYPMLPLSLFANREFTVSNIIVFVMGASMFGSLLYMPLFLQGVMKYSATESGTMMMPMTLSLVIASIAGGQALTRTGKYKNLAFFGAAVTAAGMYLLSTLGPATPMGVTLTYIIIVGLGLGIGMPVFNLTIQNAVDHGHLGVATATGQLFRQLGGTIGIAVLGSLMTHHMHAQLHQKLVQILDEKTRAALPPQILKHVEDPQLLLSPGKLAELTALLPSEMHAQLQNIINAMRESLNVGLSYVFLGGCLLMICAVAMVFMLRESQHRSASSKNVVEPEPEPAAESGS